MRLALVSLVVIAGLGSVAQAQTAATPADAAPAPAAAPAAAAPAAAAPAPAPAPVAEAPPAPPPAPTDVVAIALLNALENVCMPAVNGGDLAKIAKSAGYKKSGENFVYKQPTFQFTVLAPGSNPTQCHVDIVHPVDAEGPARPLVVALHNWAAMARGWDLYQNAKSVDAGQEFSIRSWEHTQGDSRQALVITTIRKADGTPAGRNADTSMMIYSVTKTAG